MTPSLTSTRACPTPAPRRPSLSLYLSVWAERRALAKLDATRLRDLGLTPSEAAREAARPIWDLPTHRHD